MKSLNQIYEIVLEKHMERVKIFTYISPAICASIEECRDDGLLSLEEVDKVVEHMKSQKPSEEINSEFLSSPYYNRVSVIRKAEEELHVSIKTELFGYWWQDKGFNRNEVTTQRILFLSKMIGVTKEKGLLAKIKNLFTNNKNNGGQDTK